MIIETIKGQDHAASRAIRLATHAVFCSGASVIDIENRAVAFINRKMGDFKLTHRPWVDEPRDQGQGKLQKHTCRLILDGTQRDLRKAPTTALLAPLTLPSRYEPKGSIEHWIIRMISGGAGLREPAQFASDIGLDVKRHVANLHLLRQSSPKGWRMLCGARLLDLRELLTSAPELSVHINKIIRDHIIVLGVLRARMLAEYLRRLATEPLGPRLTECDPVWVKRGAVYLDRLVKPAIAVKGLMQIDHSGGAAVEALREVVKTGHLAYDARLLPMARRVYQRCSGSLLDNDDGRHIVAAVRSAVAPLTCITPAMLRDAGLGGQRFGQAELGMSVPEAVTTLAINLVNLPQRIDEALCDFATSAVPKNRTPSSTILPGSCSRIRRVATVLKGISECDRHCGDLSANPDNKAGRALLQRTHELLAGADVPQGAALLQILPGEWLQ